jgi:WD40 repeat protein
LLPDAEHAVTSDVTGTTRIWSLNRFAAAGEQPGTIPERIRARTMLVTSDRSAIVLASEEGRFGVWSARTGELLRIQNIEEKLLGSAIAADGSVAVTIAGGHAGAAQKVRAWSLESGSLVRSLECEDFVACAVSPDGTSVVLIGEQLRVWSLASGEVRRLDWARPAGCLDFTAITPDGKHLVALSSGYDQSVFTIVSHETGHTLRAIHVTGVPARYARLSADGLWLFLATESTPRIHILCLRTGELVDTLEVSATTEFAVTPQGTRIVCAGPDRALTVWDVATRAVAGRFCHDTAFSGVAAVDEQTFAAADDWGKLHVLKLEQRFESASVRAGSRL